MCIRCEMIFVTNGNLKKEEEEEETLNVLSKTSVGLSALATTWRRGGRGSVWQDAHPWTSWSLRTVSRGRPVDLPVWWPRALHI